mgnify:CR=1 FL=1
MKRTIILLLLIPLNYIFSQSVITGKVVDGEFNDFLPFANIVLQSNEGEFIDGTSTDFEGSYTINVVAGTYILEFSFVGYDTKRITDVVVGQNEEFILNTTLLPASNSLDEVIVTTTAKNNTEASVLLIQKRAVNLIDGLSAQSIQKKLRFRHEPLGRLVYLQPKNPSLHARWFHQSNLNPFFLVFFLTFCSQLDWEEFLSDRHS